MARATVALDGLRIVPANEASWDDVQDLFGRRGDAARCQCQHWKIQHRGIRSVPTEERRELLRVQSACGEPDATETTGLVAYLDDLPVGWCAVEPRPAYPRLKGSPVPWSGRDEDPHDEGVWAVTCFFIRIGYRRRGLSYALTAATVDFARERGARALEGYPMATRPGQEITWGELYVGHRSAFAAAGFKEVSRPTLRRRVMRIDF
ncbi:MAG: GNAT family N-acetyltransferase [Actinocrinis sp.]